MMNKSWILASLGLCLLACVLMAQGAPLTVNGARVSATINPEGGSLRVWESGTSKFFTHSFSRIQEVAADGGVVNAVNSFSGITFNDPTTPQQETFQNVNATMVSISGNVPVTVAGNNATRTASLSVRFYVFEADGQISYGAKSYPVGPGSVEIIYTLAGWPVSDTANKLHIEVHVATPGKTAAWSSPELRFFDGASLIFAPQSANSNGQADVSVSTSNGNSAVNINMQFAAANSIEYDPLWSVGPESSSASALVPLLSAIF